MWDEALQPYQGDSTGDQEPFDEWHTRVSHVFPDVPRELAEQWIYTNWGAGLDFYRKLNLTALSASASTLTLDELMGVTVQSQWGAINRQELRAWAEADDTLACEMLEEGTWRKPIVVFDNSSQALGGSRDGVGRWHLLEGHRRLTCLHGLATEGKALPEHRVWIVRQRAVPPRMPLEERGFRASPNDLYFKLSEAVETLAVGAGPIHARLLRVFGGGALARIAPASFGEHAPLWEEMMASLLRVRDAERGSIVASIQAMTEREACHRARTIVILYRWLLEQRGPFGARGGVS